MTLLNWLPEIYLLILLFATLIVMNFKILSYRSLSVAIASVTLVGMGYFLLRPDLAYFEPPTRVLISDSLSYFGRLLSLVTLIVFALGFYFHRTLNFEAKQNSNLFLLFYSFFTIGLFQTNSLVLFLGAALGIYLSSMNLILIESGRDPKWVNIFRQRALAIGIWALLVSFLFVLGTHLFGSVLISDWVLAFPKYSGSESALFAFGFLILLSSLIPLGGLLYIGNAPVGISILAYSLFLVLASFWLRLGVPFFSLAPLLHKNLAQVLVSLMIGAFTLRYAWHTIRTRERHRWYASALPTVVGLSLFLILLPGEQALSAFYCISLSLLFTFSLISHAFLSEDYRFKGMLVFALAAIVGLPPFILGEEFFRVIRNAVASGNMIAGILMGLSWFGLALGVVQKISQVLLVRNPEKVRRKIYPSEIFFIAIYLVCVISLTIFRVDLVALLNEHPALNLW
jgi:hypothetical protein